MSTPAIMLISFVKKPSNGIICFFSCNIGTLECGWRVCVRYGNNNYIPSSYMKQSKKVLNMTLPTLNVVLRFQKMFLKGINNLLKIWTPGEK